jgi:hypothetical protein
VFQPSCIVLPLGLFCGLSRVGCKNVEEGAKSSADMNGLFGSNSFCGGKAGRRFSDDVWDCDLGGAGRGTGLSKNVELDA